MEPMKPADFQKLFIGAPQASPAEVEEYERLLAERFLEDPEVPAAPGDDRRAQRELRLRELQQKLFGASPPP